MLGDRFDQMVAVDYMPEMRLLWEKTWHMAKGSQWNQGDLLAAGRSPLCAGGPAPGPAVVKA
jgi:hypothetical protein